MINYQIIEQPKTLTPYFVEHNETGERAICELIRGTWQRIDSKDKLFFAYEHEAIATHEAHICPNCNEYAAFPGKYGENDWCENCIPF